jgi:hypothetical protein
MVKVASQFLIAQEPSVKDVRLEQIEQRGDNEFSIVLSFPDGTPVIGGLAFSNTRVYKELLVNSKAKEVMALRVWK